MRKLATSPAFVSGLLGVTLGTDVGLDAGLADPDVPEVALGRELAESLDVDVQAATACRLRPTAAATVAALTNFFMP